MAAPNAQMVFGMNLGEKKDEILRTMRNEKRGADVCLTRGCTNDIVCPFLSLHSSLRNYPQSFFLFASHERELLGNTFNYQVY